MFVVMSKYGTFFKEINKSNQLILVTDIKDAAKFRSVKAASEITNILKGFMVIEVKRR
mgnify:CR=1 FL=1